MSIKVTVLIVLATTSLAVARPQRYSRSEGSGVSGEVDGGDSTSYSNESGYSFSWAVDAEDSDENSLEFGHSESRSDEDDVTRGSYYVLLPDTRMMRVEYYADESGYHPTISYEGEAVYDSAESREYGSVE